MSGFQHHTSIFKSFKPSVSLMRGGRDELKAVNKAHCVVLGDVPL